MVVRRTLEERREDGGRLLVLGFVTKTLISINKNRSLNFDIKIRLSVNMYKFVYLCPKFIPTHSSPYLLRSIHHLFQEP